MATHHCIGNPCWLCFPDYAPKPDEKIYPIMLSYQFRDNKISELLEDLLVDVFQSGIGEDAHYRCDDGLTLEKIKEERTRISNDTLEAKLLDILIVDYEFKGTGY